MGEIAGVTIDFTDYTSDPSIPRTMHIPVPLKEATVQDITDTLSARQADLDNLIYANLLDAPNTGGKQPIGGGVLVGLTTTVNHTRVSFDARKASAQEGTVTTGDVNGVTLIDSAATFLTNGVIPGSQVINKTDGSRASVLRVVSETQLITDGLGDGVDNQFDVSDAYEVMAITQVEVSGGNLVAIDQIGDPAEVILPTAGTQVVRTSSASATLQELRSLQVSSFDQGEGKGVLVDPTNLTGIAVAGTAFPVGTAEAPVNNFSDALAIAAIRGFTIFYLIGSGISIDSLDFSSAGIAPASIRFIGESRLATSVTIAATANVTGCEFDSLDIQGTGDGLVLVSRCLVRNLSGVSGIVEQSDLEGTLTLSGTPNTKLKLINCTDGIVGTGIPTIDFNGSGTSLLVSKFDGGLALSNKSGPEEVSIRGMTRLVLNSDFGGSGQLVIRGIAEPIENNSSPQFTNIKDDGLVSPASVSEGVWTENAFTYQGTDSMAEFMTLIKRTLMNRLEVDVTTQELILYDDDGVTPLRRWPIQTDGGEPVTTQTGVQTKRKPSTI